MIVMKKYSSVKEDAGQLVFPEQETNGNGDIIPFAQALAHELRNPLSNIVMSVECLKETVGSDVVANSYLDIILRGATTMSNIINTLLSPQINKDEIKQYPVHKLLDEVLDTVSDRLILKGVTVFKVYDEAVHSSLMNAWDIKIALSNIIINAVEAMSEGNGRLDIITKPIKGSTQFLIQIRDNGCGINRRDIDHIFKPHFTTKPGGVGIGLAAVASILDSNHIAVSVESEVGVGTCFSLLFD